MTTLHTQSAWYNTQIFRFNKKTNRLLKIDWLLTLYQNNYNIVSTLLLPQLKLQKLPIRFQYNFTQQS